ncbi:MAG: isoprenylcysteine carboxylmethyltransferase family protein [Bacteroidales bacterium]|nr:isoprenylcysteine carboxylmethyltransferase family protein [Bacteroidales bacterium]
MKKLSFLGAGPKIGRIAIPYLLVTILISVYYKEHFVFSISYAGILFIAGAVLMTAGLIFYLITVRLLLTGLRQTRLITSGSYFCCQNPLYAALILMLMPAISLLMNSWLVLTAIFVAYYVFSRQIHSEYEEMELVFGDDYLKYRNETPEFFPFPVKKILRSFRR